MISFLKRSSFEVFIVLLIGLALLRLNFIQEDLNHLTTSIETLDSISSSNTEAKESTSSSPEKTISQLNGKYCSQIEDTFVTASFTNEGRDVLVKWMNSDRKKVYGKFKTSPKVVMNKITVNLVHPSGEEQNFVFSEVGLKGSEVYTFSIGGGVFNRENCQ
jgi:hypothetical protein